MYNEYNKGDAGSKVLLILEGSKVDLEGDTRMKGLDSEVKDRSVESVCDARDQFLKKLEEELSESSASSSEGSDSGLESSDKD